MNETVGFDVQDKTAHISSMNKTPASIVQEYAAKNHMVPQYDLIYNGIAQTKVTFKYRLTLDGYETVGEGTSKKEAKHEAANQLLRKMISDKPELLSNEFKEWDFDNHVVSPFDNNIKVNAIGKLNDICTNNRLGLPDFKLVREEGQAHAKLFTISCHVAKMTVTATHKTKKQAKHLAAVQMVNKLTVLEKSLEPEISLPPDDSLTVVKQVELIKTDSVKKTVPMDEDISGYHLLFQKTEWSNSKTLNSILKQFIHDGKLSESDPYSVLNEVVEESGMMLTNHMINSETGKAMCILSIENVYPPCCSIGINDNIELAKVDAANKLLINICILYIK